MGDAELSGDGTGAAGEVQRGTLAGIPAHFDFLPGDAVLDAGAEGFGAGFLGGETGGIALHRACSGAAVGNFRIGKDAVKKSFAEALERAGDARHFDEVDSCAYQHEATVAQGRTLAVHGDDAD